MEKKVKEKSIELPFFKRHADNLRNSAAVLLIGVSREPKRIELPLNCGACGYKSCKDLVASGKREGEDFTGPWKENASGDQPQVVSSPLVAVSAMDD